MRQLQNKIDKEYTQIGYFILALIMLRPTFYFYNYYLGRLSDLISIFLLFASIIFFHKTFEKKKIKIFLLWLGSYFVCLSISYFINNFSFILQIKDFVEWFRPIMLFLALLFGYAFFKSFKQFIGLNKLIIMISLISSMIAIFEYLNKGDIFYFLFSGPNLFEQRRPGGIAYSHVEYSFLSLLGFVSSVYLFFISKRKIYMPTALFLLSTSVLSSSKSGFLGFVIYIFFFLIYLLFTKRISLISKIAFVGSSLLLIYFLFINIPYIYRGLVSLLEFDFYSKISIYHRFQDYVVGYRYLTDNIINFLIGYTPLRNYPDTSYIEVSFVNIFFRLGLTGIIIYYFPYIYFSFSKHWLPYMVLFKILALTIVFSDFTANVSENIKLSVLLFTLYGSLLRLKYENKHNYTNL